MMKFKVLLQPENKIIECDDQSSLFEQFNKQKVHINSSCGGVASCTKCVVNILDGEENINEITFEEKKVLGNVFHLTKQRLCCQLFIKGDISLDISSHLSENKSLKKVIRRTHQEKVKLQEEKLQERQNNPKKEKEGGLRRPKAFKHFDSEK